MMLSLLRAPGITLRLARDGLRLARGGLPELIGIENLPGPARFMLRLVGGLKPGAELDPERLSQTLADLGPSHIKLGQFLATRPDVIGVQAAAGLARLHDSLPSFSDGAARREIEAAFDRPAEEIFVEFGPAIAAASIAQVHRAILKPTEEDGEPYAVAVKILRPGVERRFSRDLEGFFFAARTMEWLSAEARRLRLTEIVATLERTVELEMDLRMEASAMAEMAQNTKDDPGFAVPRVDWPLISKRVLTTTWIDGIALHDLDALDAAGHDREALGQLVIQSFLRHAMRDGFFHADMHPGNLFVDAAGTLVAVDFGIMGRLSHKDRRFLAEILFGFITRDYARVAQVHFDAGYVPERHTVQEFAQALRAIGEPILGREARDVSMARLLTQLFEVTAQFDMATQPQLILLQKTMVVVEGVGRMLDPGLNMWTTAEPVVREFMESRLSPEGRILDAAEGAAALGRIVAGLPEFLEEAERATANLARLASENERNRDGRAGNEALRLPLWVGAWALVVIAFIVLF
ncbi:Ubiquinone biosynthesis regulatory protein kinase UbiB [hydrothermal vent metagenome]|uniref:Ubiquinone biosynthesis regulatory protein kinase UbiB n=1 Tax=hydrothermal vent metagenome TaxID=652676 RepID=A0A3B0SW79_9ZZZZ